MKKTVMLIFTALVTLSCQNETDRYLDFLYDCMPLPDRMVHSRDWWEANVEKTLEVRDLMGWDIPEREFRHFVMPLRVNNEALDDFRLVYADSLCERVKGLTMAEAALELNHWCHERATYKPSDARTSSPMATIRAGLGRCGEESVLAVAAMRAAGIPARQVYTPRWAHTDDNHAWVEVYVDGEWHFMGACEPEPALDIAWFNAPVSRAMLLHTKVFGDYHGEEDVIARTKAYTEINVIKGYVPSRRNTVTVVDAQGQPVEGAKVEFRIYNYAEFYPVASYLTDTKGQASLDTGLGALFVWASRGDSFGFGLMSEAEGQIQLAYKFGEHYSFDLHVEPPMENPLPADASQEVVAANALRLAEEDAMRAARLHGQEAVLDAFKAAHPGQRELCESIVNSLSIKDLNDVTREVLEDALAHAGAEFSPYKDCPRIELEALHPYFGEIGEGLSPVNARDLWQWTLDNIQVDNASNPQMLRIPPVFVWRERVADTHSRDIFYVALCRALGFPARIDEVTGKVQYGENGIWYDIKTEENAPQGTLMLSYGPEKPVKSPTYYTHFTLSAVRDGSTALLTFDESGDVSYESLFGEPVRLDEGYYLLTTGRRLADGSALVHLDFFPVERDQTTDLSLTIRSAENSIPVLGSFDAEKLYLPEYSDSECSILSTTGRGWFILAVVGEPGDEPSAHALRQFEAASGDINDWGHPAVILRRGGTTAPRVQGLDNAHFGIDLDGKITEMLAAGVSAEGQRLPVVVVGDSFGRIVYYSHGYNTSLAEDLRNILPRL